MLGTGTLGWPRWMVQGGRWEGSSGGGHMYTHGWFMSMNGKNHYNIVISLQLKLKKKRIKWGTFLVVHWLRLHGPYAGGTGLIPCLEIHLAQCHQKQNKNKNPKNKQTKSGTNGMQLQRLGHRGNRYGILTWWTIAAILWAAIWRSPDVEKPRLPANNHGNAPSWKGILQPH